MQYVARKGKRKKESKGGSYLGYLFYLCVPYRGAFSAQDTHTDLSEFDVRVKKILVVIIVHVPIACPPCALRAGIFDQATQPLRLEGGT